MHRHFHPKRDRRIETIYRHFTCRRGLWQRCNCLNRGTARILEDECGDAVQSIEVKFPHHFSQPTMTNLVTGRQRIDVTDQLVRFTHIAANNPCQRLIHLAFVSEFHDGDVQPFFIDAVRIGAKTAPPDIDNMRRAGKEPNQHPVVKRRRNHRDIMQMAGAFPWVIGDIDVTLEYVLTTNAADEMRHCIRHRVDVPGRAGDGLCKHPTMGVIDPGRQITRLSYRC